MMLQAMRKNMKVILWVTIIFFVLLIFLVWGADLQFGGSGPPPNSVGEVNGVSVSASNYQQILASNRQNASRLGQDLQPNDELQLQEQAWNAMVTEMLLRQEAERRGMAARDAEVRSILLNNPPDIITQDPTFRNAQGQFDLATYRARLYELPENYRLQLEGYVRQTLPIQKLQTLILSGAKVTEEELRRDWLMENEKANVTFTLADFADVTIDEEVTEEQITRYYQEHTADYKTTPSVDILYVSIPRVPTGEDSAILIRDLEEFADDARAAEAGKASGEEDLSISDFATLAQTFSDAPSAEEGGLSAGYLTGAEMTPAIATAIEGLAPGEVSEPFQDGLMFHILQLVDEKPSDDGERTVQIRILSKRIVPSDNTLSNTASMLQDLQTEARSGGLSAAAAAAGLTLQIAEGIGLGGASPGLSAIPQVGVWAHQTSQGTVSRIYETNAVWLLLEVGPRQPPGTAEPSRVRNRIIREIQIERRLEASRATIDRVSGQIKLGESLETAAAAESLQVIETTEVSRLVGLTRLGKDFEVLGTIFTLPVGAVSQPIKSLRGWVIVRVDERLEIDWIGFETQKLVQSRAKLSMKENRVYNEFLDALRRKAEITDSRI